MAVEEENKIEQKPLTKREDEPVRETLKSENDDMKKSREEIVFEKAKTSYGEVVKVIGSMHDAVLKKNGSFKYAKEELFKDYDAYLQAVLVKICFATGTFSESEMKFIENIADYGKLYDGTNLIFFANTAYDIRQKLCEKAETRLKEIPVAFKLSAAIDSGKNVGITKKMLDETSKIAFNCKLVCEGADIKDNSDISAALKGLYAYALAKLK